MRASSCGRLAAVCDSGQPGNADRPFSLRASGGRLSASTPRIRGTFRTSHIARLCGRPELAAVGVPEPRLLQTLFAVVLTANSGYEHVGLVTESSDDLESSTVETLTVDHDLRVSELASRWMLRELQVPKVSDSGIRATAALGVLELPAFRAAVGDLAQGPGKIARPGGVSGVLHSRPAGRSRRATR